MANPDVEVLHNPSRENSALLVYRQPSPNALVVLELAKNGTGTDIVNVLAARDREVKRMERKSAEWLEGRRPTLIQAAERSPAGGEISDVQPIGTASLGSNDGNFKQGAGSRGAFDPVGRIISILKDADLSTIHHELGHAFLENMVKVAEQSPRMAAHLRHQSSRNSEASVI